MLGHAATRGLPLRQVSATNGAESPHYKARDDDLRLSSGSGIPSPPSSRSSSGDEEVEQVVGGAVRTVKSATAGTFVVKEGVEDDRGAALARKGLAKSKSDMFGPIALARMFEPPSPPTAPIASSSSAPVLPTPIADAPRDPVRRLSHAYTPTNPSRLSKSITPSVASSSFSQPANTSVQQPDDSVLQSETVLRDDTHAPAADATSLSHIAGDQYPFTFHLLRMSMSPKQTPPSIHPCVSVQSRLSRRYIESPALVNTSPRLLDTHRGSRPTKNFASSGAHTIRIPGSICPTLSTPSLLSHRRHRLPRKCKVTRLGRTLHPEGI